MTVRAADEAEFRAYALDGQVPLDDSALIASAEALAQHA
jgi:hypothetical protein